MVSWTQADGDKQEQIELPEKFAGGKTRGQKIYTPANLWDYIDGGAELFLSYGFQTPLPARLCLRL